jgi:hypothetical protein
MFTASFWQDTFVRAVKTFAQALAALLVADGTDLLNTVWADRLSVAGMAALVSVLTTIASSATTGSPAVGEAVTPNADVVVLAEHDRVAKAMGGSIPITRFVAGPAAPQPDGTAVTVEGA